MGSFPPEYVMVTIQSPVSMGTRILKIAGHVISPSRKYKYCIYFCLIVIFKKIILIKISQYNQDTEETYPVVFLPLHSPIPRNDQKKSFSLLYLFQRLDYNCTLSKANSDTNIRLWFCHSFFGLTASHFHQQGGQFK